MPLPTPEIDAQVLRNLADIIGANSVYELIGIYLDDAPAQMTDFLRGIDQGDLTLARRAVHNLKSTAGNLGARAFARYCEEIETTARIGDVSELHQTRPELERRLAEVLAELMRAREQYRT